MAWFYLILGGLFEVAFTTCLGKIRGATTTEAIWWFIAFLISCSISMFLLYKAANILPMGTSYAVWAGIGAVGTVLVGIFVFKESVDFWRIFFLFTLIVSIVGLNLAAK